MYSNPRNFFRFLQSSWRIHRECYHLKQGVFAGQGTASFKLIAPNELLYEENLQIEYHTHHPPSLAHKEYLYKLEEDEINIYFLDNGDSAFFLRMNFLEQQHPIIATGTHHCHPDIYSAKFIHHNSKEFGITYDISGPKKSHLISSKYLREK